MNFKRGLYPFILDVVNFNILNKKKKSENTESNQTDSEKQFIHFFERQLPEEMFQIFKATERVGVWNGEVKNEGLFQYWLKMKGKTR